jgi:hypothetical protein
LGASQPLRLLVDTRWHGEELARFESLVVRGPDVDDCAILRTAIGGDGYGPPARCWPRRWENIVALAHRGDLVGAEAGVHGAAGHLHEHQDIGFDVVADVPSGDGADVAGGDR